MGARLPEGGAVSDYTYWRAALAGNFGPVHDGDPQPGFYRAKVTRGPYGIWTPVAIWPEPDGTLTALKHVWISRSPVFIDPDEVWLWCSQNPITEEAYRAVAEQKQPWPDGSLLENGEKRHE